MKFVHPAFPGDEFNSILNDLVELKRDKLLDKLGGNYGSLTISIEKLIKNSSFALGIDKPFSGSHYTLLLAQCLQREFVALYERCATHICDPCGPLLENYEVETLRKFDEESIYNPPSQGSFNDTKRHRQLQSLYSVCKEYLEEIDEED